MPDIVLVQDGSRVGAVNYADLNLRWQDSRFIEAESGHTWQHPNKSGGPDRHFKGYRQIPICLYETMNLSSAKGLNKLVEFSRVAIGIVACVGLLANALLSSNGDSTSGPPASVAIAPSASPMPAETDPAPDALSSPVAPPPIEAAANVEIPEPASPSDAGIAPYAPRYTTTDVNLRSGPGRQFGV